LAFLQRAQARAEGMIARLLSRHYSLFPIEVMSGASSQLLARFIALRESAVWHFAMRREHGVRPPLFGELRRYRAGPGAATPPILTHCGPSAVNFAVLHNAARAMTSSTPHRLRLGACIPPGLERRGLRGRREHSRRMPLGRRSNRSAVSANAGVGAATSCRNRDQGCPSIVVANLPFLTHLRHRPAVQRRVSATQVLS
jgi:hypothetical protein